MMPLHRLYLLHPQEVFLQGVAAWVREAKDAIATDPDWSDWETLESLLDNQNNFHLQPLFVRVLNKPGPVVLLGRVQRSTLEDLRERLRLKTIVLVEEIVNDSTDVFRILTDARLRFESGQPFLPKRFVLAVMIIRKLRKGNYWAGKDKGYLWSDNLARGRGVDDRYANVVPDIANTLHLEEILISKTSKGKTKYALNPKRKEEIHAIANDETFPDSRLRRILMADTDELPANLLKEPRLAQRFLIEGTGAPSAALATATQAIDHARTLAICQEYRLQVTFDGGHHLFEILQTHQLLIQVLEGFL